MSREDSGQSQTIKAILGLRGMIIEAHLKPGERVVIEGLDRLREGSKVEVIADDGQTVPTPAPKDEATDAAPGR